MIKFFKIKYLIYLILITGCGYQPIYSGNDINFSIGETKTSGDRKLNNIINSKLEIYKNQENQSIIFDLDFLSKINKLTTSNDTKGNPKTFRIEVDITLKVIEDKKIKYVKNFIKSTNYNNTTNKFNLKKYEEIIKENLFEVILEDIIKYLETIKI